MLSACSGLGAGPGPASLPAALAAAAPLLASLRHLDLSYSSVASLAPLLEPPPPQQQQPQPAALVEDVAGVAPTVPADGGVGVAGSEQEAVGVGAAGGAVALQSLVLASCRELRCEELTALLPKPRGVRR